MFLTFLTLAVALCLSAVAAFYSIVGLTAIFAAAVIPIVIMGSILEIAKLVVTVWLHRYWKQCRVAMKLYLVPAVVILMLITSMGIFGFLSKAHMDQGMVSGDVQARIAIYDEKIRIAKENIDANRRQLKQMDEAVDQIMGRSTTETGAERSVQIRRQQGPERQRLIREIEAEQKKITALNEERAPIAAEIRKVEAEVGPIKYIAALIYDEQQDANALERAVRWVIITLVIVFDPLAVMMLLAASESRRWEKQNREEKTNDSDANDGNSVPQNTDRHPGGSVDDESHADVDRYAYLKKPWVWRVPDEFRVGPQVAPPATPLPETMAPVAETDEPEEQEESETLKIAKTLWKRDHPYDTLKNQRSRLASGHISYLPWEDYLVTDAGSIGHGNQFPPMAEKSDLWIRTDSIPSRLFKFNGSRWIEVDKSLTDRYAYNDAYIDFLIEKLSTGEYDPDLLTTIEQTQVELKLKQESN